MRISPRKSPMLGRKISSPPISNGKSSRRLTAAMSCKSNWPNTKSGLMPRSANWWPMPPASKLSICHPAAKGVRTARLSWTVWRRLTSLWPRRGLTGLRPRHAFAKRAPMAALRRRWPTARLTICASDGPNYQLSTSSSWFALSRPILRRLLSKARSTSSMPQSAARSAAFPARSRQSSVRPPRAKMR